MIEVIRCGTKISILDNIEATITGINIRYGKVQYELSYIYEGAHKNNWFYDDELLLKSYKKEKIGFKNDN